MTDIAKFYGKAFVSAFNGEIDFNSHTIKAMVCSVGYVPDQDAHQYKSDVTNEITGTGYTAGGVTLGTCTISYDGATNTLKLDCDDFNWGPGATFTGRVIVVYDSTPGSDATRPLIMYVLFDADKPVTSSTFSVTVNSNGLATVTVS